MKKKIIFDRDGTLIYDLKYIRRPQEVKLIPSAVKCLKSLKELNLDFIVISNQSGVGRGLITSYEARSVHLSFIEQFHSESIDFLDVEYCFHDPTDDCDCRKPKLGLISNKGITNEEIICVVGDQQSDYDMAKRLGCSFFGVGDYFQDPDYMKFQILRIELDSGLSVD